MFGDLGSYASTRIPSPFDLIFEGTDLRIRALLGGLEFVIGLGKAIQDVNLNLLAKLVPLIEASIKATIWKYRVGLV